MTSALPAASAGCVWTLSALPGNDGCRGFYLLFPTADSGWRIPAPSPPLCHFHHVPRPFGPPCPGSPDFWAAVSFISLRLLSSGSPPHTSASSNATFYRCIGRGRTRVLQLRKYNRLAVRASASRCGWWPQWAAVGAQTGIVLFWQISHRLSKWRDKRRWVHLFLTINTRPIGKSLLLFSFLFFS